MSHRPTRPAVLATAVITVLSVLAAGLSSAAAEALPAAFSDCPSGSVCLWKDANYSGTILILPGTATTVNNLASYSFDDAMTSWANRSSLDARWFYGTSLGGTTRCMNAGSAVSNVGSTDNDQASSLRIYTDSLACT